MSDIKIYFYKGLEEVLAKGKDSVDDVTDSDLLKKIQDAFSKVLDGKNLSFLLGSGCSSYAIEVENNSFCTGINAHECGNILYYLQTILIIYQ